MSRDHKCYDIAAVEIVEDIFILTIKDTFRLHIFLNFQFDIVDHHFFRKKTNLPISD